MKPILLLMLMLSMSCKAEDGYKLPKTKALTVIVDECGLSNCYEMILIKDYICITSTNGGLWCEYADVEGLPEHMKYEEAE